MKSCARSILFKRDCFCQVCLVLVASILLFTSSFFYLSAVYAEDSNVAGSSESHVINISFANERYSLNAEQADLSNVLSELGKVAGFEFKTFDEANAEKTSWNFNSMTLSQLLSNLLRGYSSVMLYEETQDKEMTNNNRKLKELWLIAKENSADLDDKSIVNIEIELEQPNTLPDVHEEVTPEQQYEISHIDNLEGMTSDDVIETLKLTLATEKDPLIRKRAVAALSDIGGVRVIEALESGLGDDSAMVRTELAKSFAGIKHQKSMLALGQLLMGDSDVGVRQEAIRALYQQDGPAARSFVETAQKDKDDRVNKVANEVLKQWVLTPEAD